MFKLRQTIRAFQCKRHNSSDLKAVLACKIPIQRDIVKELRQHFGKEKLGEVTVNMVYGGMRGIKGLVCETSVLDPEDGIRFRGYSIQECLNLLPKGKTGKQPLPEGLFWLLLTGDIPTTEQVRQLTAELNKRAKVPHHVLQMLCSLPNNVHPMSQLSAACILMNTESLFTKCFKKVKKQDYWEFIYEDTLDLIGALPTICALIYQRTFKNNSSLVPTNEEFDWSQNLAVMLGFDCEEFIELMRLYMVIHSDHEGGNVSAHATHLVGSALSDPYLAYAAGINGLAGPLHGLANQEVLTWLMEIVKEVGNEPTEEQLRGLISGRLNKGRVVPGYGHAVLRKTDPRYEVLHDFGKEYLPDDTLFKLVQTLYKIVPDILGKLGKVQNPWPNVDAHSGILLHYYGMKEMNYYTVLFGMSRALGVCAQLVWSRALGFPIERPKSLSTVNLVKMFCEKLQDKKC